MSGTGAFLSGLGGSLQMGMQSKQRDKELSIMEELAKSRGGTAGEAGPPPASGAPTGATRSPQGAPPSTRTGGGGSGDRDAFIASMMPHAVRVGAETGIDPRIIIAQSAQETGWGKSAPNNNYFGHKSHGKAGGSVQQTNEVVNGQTVTINDSFRGYGDMGESVSDYGRFLTENKRYGKMLSAQGLDAQVYALGESGYATDPNYANSVGSIARSITIPGQQTPDVRRPKPRPTERGTIEEAPIADQLIAMFKK